MLSYILRRLTLLPITLFAIISINFLIINLAPGEPSTISQTSKSGDTQAAENQTSGLDDDPYSLFRARYGLNLPIIFNMWMWESSSSLAKEIQEWIDQYGNNDKEINSSSSRKLKRHLKDKAAYQMPQLLSLLISPIHSLEVKQIVNELMIAGATRLGTSGFTLTAAQQRENEEIASDNRMIRQWQINSLQELTEVQGRWQSYLKKRPDLMHYHSSSWRQALGYTLKETRFVKYLSRLFHLDFGTLRQDPNRYVTQEVIQRLPISLALAVIPMLISLLASLFFGMIMALQHHKFLDWGLNLSFLILYATPVFVVGPWLIENVADKAILPGLQITFPADGFHSPHQTYMTLNSAQRLADISWHMLLPIVTVVYGTWASKSRLARTAILEVMRQDYVTAAKSRGLSRFTIWTQYILRGASITLITALAGSLSVILGGSLIIETLFEIDGFGKFFYEAIVSRDINVMMFSTLLGSALSLLGYLLADITYTVLDPRVKFD